MSKIFISYRRSDSRSITGRILDRLKMHFKTEEVFMDVEAIPPGVNFLDYTNQRLAGAEIFIPIIGKTWAKSLKTREVDTNDFVRIEVEQALERKIPILPILVEGAKMPKITELPASVAKIVYYNSIEVRPDPDFENDANKLVNALKSQVSAKALRPKEKSRADLMDKMKYVAAGAVVLLVGGFYYLFFYNRETCERPKMGILIANFQEMKHDGFANSILTELDSKLVDSLYDVRSVGFQPRDKVDYEGYVKKEFFGTECTPAGLFVNGFLSQEQQVFNLYTSIVNMEINLPEFIKDKTLVLSNPKNVEFSIRKDASYVAELILAITQLHDGQANKALVSFEKLEKEAGTDKELKANLSFFKGQCYAVRGDEVRAKREYKEAQNTDSFELHKASVTNSSKANGISQAYINDPLMAMKRLEYLQSHTTLENEIKKAIRRKIKNPILRKLFR